MMPNPFPSKLKTLSWAVLKIEGMMSNIPIFLVANAGIQVRPVTPSITIKDIK